MTTLSKKAWTAVLWGLACLAPAASAQTFSGHKLCYCTVTGLSDDGRIATGQMQFLYQHFRWVEGQGLELLGRGTGGGGVGKRFGRAAISGDGQTIAGTIMDDTGQFATLGRWTATAGWDQVPLPFEMDPESIAAGATLGLSRDGRVVTGYYFGGGLLSWPARWEAPAAGQILEGEGAVFAANQDGRVLAGHVFDQAGGTKQAAVWVDGHLTVLGEGTINAINAAGTVAVGQAPVPAFPRLMAPAVWRWNGSAWDLSLLVMHSPRFTSDSAAATDLSDDGRTVVGNGRVLDGSGGAATQHGFIWTESEGMFEAEHYFEKHGYPVTKRMRITSIDTVSADGRVMGVNGYDNASRTAVGLVVRRLDP